MIPLQNNAAGRFEGNKIKRNGKLFAAMYKRRFGVIALLAGPIMLLTGLWIVGSLGTARIPLRAGGVASLVVGAALIVGVVAYVIPCTGPS